MKIQLLGIAVILCSIAWLLAYSSMQPQGIDGGTALIGLIIALVGLIITIAGVFKSENKDK